MSSRKKFSPSGSAPADELTSQSTQQPPPRQQSFPPESNLKSPSPQQQQQPGPVQPWSVHQMDLLPPPPSKNTPPSNPSPSPFPRSSHGVSATASAAGELFLFGGDFSATLLKTSGEVPSPRAGHACARIGDALLIRGGGTNTDDQGRSIGPYDDSLYLLNLVSRGWTRVVVSGHGPVGRYHHAATTIGYKFFVFGGKIHGKSWNDMWAFDLNSLKSNPVWDLYEPAPGGEKPPPRAGHVLVTTGDPIILFGGINGRHYYNDTWLFEVSTLKWTELQCTGYTPSPRHSHAAALVDDVMYVFGGRVDGASVGDLLAFRLSTQRWSIFQNIMMGPSPSRRWWHAMASDGIRVFVLGGQSSETTRGDETALIHVLDTKSIKYPNSDPDAVKPNEKTIQLARKSSAGPSTQEQPQHPTSRGAYAVHDVSPFQKASVEELGRPAFPQIAREQIPSLSGLPGCVPEEDDNGGGSAEYRAKSAVADTPFEGEYAQLELERQLSATLAALNERDQHMAQLTDDLRECTDRLLAQTSLVEQKDADLLEMRATLDELLLSRDQHARALEQADERSQRTCEQIGKYETELAEVRAELGARKSELEAVRLRFTEMENGWTKSNETDADALRGPTTAGLVGKDEDRIMRGIVERIRAEIAALRLGEKAQK